MISESFQVKVSRFGLTSITLMLLGEVTITAVKEYRYKISIKWQLYTQYVYPTSSYLKMYYK